MKGQGIIRYFKAYPNMFGKMASIFYKHLWWEICVGIEAIVIGPSRISSFFCGLTISFQKSLTNRHIFMINKNLIQRIV